MLRALHFPGVAMSIQHRLKRDASGRFNSDMIECFRQVGSTEWVEQNNNILDASAVVYMNVDCAVAGPGLNAGASPQLDDLLIEITKQVRAKR
jgi:hypothetical protein